MDREKVIKGLENCITGFDCPTECPYLMDCNDLAKPMFVDLAKDALAMLKEQGEQIKNRDESLEKAREEIKWLRGMMKEQEAVKPKSKVRHGETCQYQHWCGNCMVMLHGKPKFCPNCGRAVKWE